MPSNIRRPGKSFPFSGFTAFGSDCIPSSSCTALLSLPTLFSHRLFFAFQAR